MVIAMQPILGSHVGMSGKEMMLGSAKEAVSYGADTFMLYTGAPQNTKMKDISELNISPAWEYMGAHGIEDFVVHAPYIINLANTVNPATYEIAVEFLALEIERTIAMGSHILILHPGSHVGAGVDAGIDRIALQRPGLPHRTGDNGREGLRNRPQLRGTGHYFRQSRPE